MIKKIRKFIVNTAYSIQHTAYVKSFTLIELLISVAILTVMVTFGVASFSGLQTRKAFILDGENIVEAIRNTQNRSMTQEDGYAWSIKFTNSLTEGSYFEIYSGSYATSTVSLRKSLSSKSSFTNPAVGFSKTISFAVITGTPTNSDSLTIKRNVGGSELMIINVNSIGKISYNIESALVGYWPGDEGSDLTAYDASFPLENAVFNTSRWSLVCKSGGCPSFIIAGPIVYRYLTATNDGNFNVPGALTLSSWVYPTGPGAGNIADTIVTGVGSFSMYFMDDSNNLACGRTGTTPSGNQESTVSSVPLNQWTFVSCVWDDSAINIYINGQLNSSTAMTGTGVDSGDVIIGAESLDNQYEGLIDDIRIYNRALSGTEELDLYNSY